MAHAAQEPRENYNGNANGSSMSGSGTCYEDDDDDEDHHQYHWRPSSATEEEEDSTLTPAQFREHLDGKTAQDGFAELVKYRRDQNNNETPASRVMMMVAKYESGGGGKIPSGSARVDETETSDFETASISSYSGTTGGSVRTSSVFSDEGSRDGATSVEGREEPEIVGKGESHVVTAGGATITINIISKTECDDCDKPAKTASTATSTPEKKAVQTQIPEFTSDEGGLDEEENDQVVEESQLFYTAQSQDFLELQERPASSSSNSCYDDSSVEDIDCVDAVNQQHEVLIHEPHHHQQSDIDSEDHMINIVQELTADLQLTSKVIVNKAKLKQHRKVRAEKQQQQQLQQQKREKKKLDNSHLSRQKIIDDNFCNEILDSTIHFDRLYGITRKSNSAALVERRRQQPTEVLSDSALQSPPSSVGEESFDSTVSFGKLEGQPRYSGRPMGKLMARRLKKIERQTGGKDERREVQCRSEGHSDSSTSNYANGPKKPPRTFASTVKKQHPKVGWVDRVVSSKSRTTKTDSERPSCPKLEDLDSDPDLMGWKFDTTKKKKEQLKQEKSHEIGWDVAKERKNEDGIPPHIYNMLHYSEDETQRRLIKTSHSRAAPQSSTTSCCHHREELLGHKLDIDTVDFPMESSRRKRFSNSEFERFVENSRIKSTPRRSAPTALTTKRTEQFLEAERGQRKQQERRSQPAEVVRRTTERSEKKVDRRRTVGDFLDHERSAHFLGDGRRSDHDYEMEQSSKVCSKCNNEKEKSSFRKAAVRRTKSFFEASKKKILLPGLLQKNAKERNLYETPKKYQLGTNLNSAESSVQKQVHKHLGFTPPAKEEKMVKNNMVLTKSAPGRISGKPQLPARTVLNFSSTTETDDDRAKQQKPHEMKFLKTLKNLKISPKKLFKPSQEETPKHSQPGTSSSPRQYGNFQSYDDLNLDNVAQMGDFLNNVRQAVETDDHDRSVNRFCAERYVKATSSTPRRRPRAVSTSSEFLDHHRQVEVCADLHREPIYQEISPKNNKTLINEFISGESPERTMVNNNALYTTVNKTAKTQIKPKSLNNSQDNLLQVSTLKKINAEPSPSTSTSPPGHHNTRRSLFDVAAGSGSNDGPSPGSPEQRCDNDDILVLQDDAGDRDTDAANPGQRRRPRRRAEVVEEVVVKKCVARVEGAGRSRIVEETEEEEDEGYRKFSSDIQPGEGEDDFGGRELTAAAKKDATLAYVEDVLRKTGLVEEAIGRAPLGFIDTDDETESLQKYEDRGLDELIVSLHEHITISEIGTIDTESDGAAYVTATATGIDTVDAMTLEKEVDGDGEVCGGSIDTDDVSELMSGHGDEDAYSVGVSPVESSSASSPSSSSGKGRVNGSGIYRSFKDRLRSSFRKSRNFIKNEQRKIENYFETKSGGGTPRKGEEKDRVGFDVSAYGRKYAEDSETEEIYQSLSNEGSLVELSNAYLAELIGQIKTQCDTKKQLKQALGICRNTREFECSSELIEAERLLLLSTLKETAARNELSKIDYNANGKVPSDSKKVGVVALNHFEFPLKDAAVRDMLFNYFYVVVCSYKNQVKATLAKERSEDRVYFRNCEIKFLELDADYEIRVEVFVLRLRKNAKNYSFESKYHLKKENKNILGACPSPPKLLSPSKLLSLNRSGSPKNFDYDNEFSRFKSQGFITLTSFSLLPSKGHPSPSDQLAEQFRHSPYYSASNNFQQMVRRRDDQNLVYLVEDFKYLPLDSMAYSSNLLGSLGMSIKSEIVFVDSDMSGFLTVGENGRNGRTDWNRRWCRVNGFVMEFWNYPQECQEKLPTLQIDLAKCLDDEVTPADRATCSRPRTFRLDVFVKGTGSCSSSGIGSYKDSDSAHQQQQHHQAHNGSDSGHSHDLHQQQKEQQQQQNQQVCDNTKNYLLSADTNNELKAWLNELNRVVKFLKEWKI
ncbi:uncharacterized protein LOC120428758 isoform X2 [Culex pipiens pallens]|uniref:uncharacterized protein LOC120428758 isoform X2 n=1 Tax=Culex pipiens pallens TaxID=42434 RepID=UPI001953A599|nr:uncharacterized protein LOC120428758 isoform X2 [Culex pipiens pallens]